MKLEQYLELFLKLDLGLEPGTSGDYTLYKKIFPKGSKFKFIPDNYNALLMGFETREIITDHEYIYYDLNRKDHCIMGSALEIIFTQYVPYQRARGNVLLGGFGLGILAKMLCDKEDVTSVTSIEYSGDVIKLCSFNDEKLTLIENDFYSFVKNTDLTKYDYIYVDTFTSSDDNTTYSEMIIPMKKYLLENYPHVMADFWQEDEFKAQFFTDQLMTPKNRTLLLHKLYKADPALLNIS